MSPRSKKLFWFLSGCVVGSALTIAAAAVFHRYFRSETLFSEGEFVPDPDCPRLPAAKPDWLAREKDLPDTKNNRLPVPPGLKPRVEFWKQIWSQHPNRVYLLVDERRPWVIYGRVDCRDLFQSKEARDRQESRCDSRLLSAKRKLSRKLRRRRRRPRRALVRLLGNDRRLARTAYRHIKVLEGRREDLQEALGRARPYLDDVESVFARHGLPPALSHVAFIESLFMPSVVSSAGAVGAYQFVENTAKQFLMIAEGVDERLDPVREAWAAASYLKELHQTFGSWPLALTAYNTGPSRMRRLIRRRRTRNIAKLANLGNYGNFGFDGQNYYAQLAAVVQLTRRVERDPVPPPMVVEVTRPVPLEKLAGCLNISPEQLAAANPAFTRAIHRGQARVPQGYLLSVPSSDHDPAEQKIR